MIISLLHIMAIPVYSNFNEDELLTSLTEHNTAVNKELNIRYYTTFLPQRFEFNFHCAKLGSYVK